MPVKKKSSVSKTRKKPANKGISKISFTAQTDKPIKFDKACCKTYAHHGTCPGAFYFMGFLGAAIYYISTATGFWMGVWGVIKALVWPVLLVFKLMASLGM